MRFFFLFLVSLVAACSSTKQPAESSEAVTAPADEPVAKEAPAPVSEPVAEEEGVWIAYDVKDLPDLERRINPSEFTLWMCNYEGLEHMLDDAETPVALPTGTGMTSFVLENSGTMAPELAAKFPNIRTLKGASADGTISSRVDTNDEGLFCEFKSDSETMYLSPLLKGSKVYYALYSKGALANPGRDHTFK